MVARASIVPLLLVLVSVALLPSAQCSPLSLLTRLLRPFSPLVTPDPATYPAGPPVVLNVSGCARAFLNWTVDCGGGETLRLHLVNVSWIDSAMIVSPHTGHQYTCDGIRMVDPGTMTCVAPKVQDNEVGQLLTITVHDEISNTYSAKAFALEYNRTTPHTSD